MGRATELASLLAELARAGAGMHAAVDSATVPFVVSDHLDRHREQRQRIAQQLTDYPVEPDPTLLDFGTVIEPTPFKRASTT